MRILTTAIGISPEVGSVCKQCVVSKNNLCTFVLQVHCALWQKKSSRFWMCSPSFPSSYCAQLPCHQHPRGNRGQQAKTSKSKSIVGHWKPPHPAFSGRQAGRWAGAPHLAHCYLPGSSQRTAARLPLRSRRTQLPTRLFLRGFRASSR